MQERERAVGRGYIKSFQISNTEHRILIEYNTIHSVIPDLSISYLNWAALQPENTVCPRTFYTVII